jgi:hypothetical protein
MHLGGTTFTPEAIQMVQVFLKAREPAKDQEQIEFDDAIAIANPTKPTARSGYRITGMLTSLGQGQI